MRTNIANNLKTTLEALCLDEWQHVVVRRKTGRSIEYLGGGKVDKIISRFGNETINKSQFIEGVFVIFVD